MPKEQKILGFVTYKFKRCSILYDISLLTLLKRCSLFKGPVQNMISLQIISLEKQLFCLNIERGTQVRIPNSLDISRLPQSYRYYDALIFTIKQNFTSDKKDFAKLRKSISYAFDQKFHEQSFFRKGNNNDAKKKLTTKHSFNKKKTSQFDFCNSMHVNQVQNSQFIMIDEDFIEHA